MSLKASFERHRLVVGHQRRKSLLEWCKQSFTENPVVLSNALVPITGNKVQRCSPLQRTSSTMLKILFPKQFSQSPAMYFHDNFAVLSEKMGHRLRENPHEDSVLGDMVGQEEPYESVLSAEIRRLVGGGEYKQACMLLRQLDDDELQRIDPALRGRALAEGGLAKDLGHFMDELVALDSDKFLQVLQQMQIPPLNEFATSLTSREFGNMETKLAELRANEFSSVSNRLVKELVIDAFTHNNTDMIQTIRATYTEADVTKTIVQYWSDNFRELGQPVLERYVSTLDPAEVPNFYHCLREYGSYAFAETSLEKWVSMNLNGLDLYKGGFGSEPLSSLRTVMAMFPQNGDSLQVAKAAERILADKPDKLALLLSTLIFIYHKTGVAENLISIMKFKSLRGLRVVAQDLEYTLETLNNAAIENRRLYADALAVYNEYPQLHDKLNRTVVLEMLAANQDLKGLQQQFESILAEGTLPTPDEYALIMTALAVTGDLDSLETLFQQYLHTGQRPTDAILSAMMRASVISRNVTRAFEIFSSYPEYGLPYSPACSYIFLDALSRLDDLEKSRAVLNQLHSEGFEIEPRLFYPYLRTLARLGAYRQVKLASDVYIKKWMKEEIPLSAKVIQLHAMLVAKKFPELLTEISKLEDTQEVKPMLGFYNLKMETFLATERYADLEDTLVQMQTNKVVPDAHTQEMTLQFYGESIEDNKDILKRFEKYLDETHVQRITAQHYSGLMRGLLKQRKFAFVLKLYNQMIVNEVPISVPVYDHVVAALEGRNGFNAIGYKSAREILDVVLNPKTGFRYDPPIRLLRRLVHHLVHNENYKEADKYLHLFSKRVASSNTLRLRLLQLYCYRFGEAKDWKNFDIYFREMLDGYAKLIDQLGVKYVKKNFLPMRGCCNELWRYRVEQLFDTHRKSKIIPEMRWMVQRGFVLNNDNLNYTMMLLLTRKKTIYKAVEFIEEFMTDEFIQIQGRRKMKRLGREATQNVKLGAALQRSVYNHMIRCVDEYITTAFRDESVREREIDRLTKTYRILKYFRERRLWTPPPHYWEELMSRGFEKFLHEE